jgi:hypothetical protein
VSALFAFKTSCIKASVILAPHMDMAAVEPLVRKTKLRSTAARF